MNTQLTQISNDNQFLPASSVWKRYRVTPMSGYGWLADEKLGFPRPIYIGRFRYWRLSELVAWEASRPKTGKPVSVLRTAKTDQTAAQASA